MIAATRAPRLHPLAWACLAVLGTVATPTGAQTSATTEPSRVEVLGISPLAGTGVTKDKIAANAQTANAADLDRSQANDLTSFMSRRLGSVHLNEVQNNPFQPDVNYRGFTASPLLGAAQGLSIYMDGVRLNQPFGDVVSWDLVPKAAIASITLNPGSNPLFGLNTLGGALAVQTKDGAKFPGTSAQVQVGSHKRISVEVETGGSREDGLNWYATANQFKDDGWRVDSPSDVLQLFGKVGQRFGDTRLTLTAAAARTDLNGNGLQDAQQLSQDWNSVYSRPDNTKNRSLLLNLAFSHGLSEQLTLTGQAYYRKVKSRTFNGDVNDDALDQAVYQPNAAERTALTNAGFTGFPTAGESAANTPFPKWRCIANALLLDEPAEKCDGVLNTTRTDQSNQGLGLQLNYDGPLFGLPSQSLVGLALDSSRSQFVQGSELGYLNADRTITGVGAFGDGVNGGDVDGEPYDTRVDLSGRTRTYSAFASSVLTLARGTHLTLAGRYNRSTIRNRDAIIPGGGAGSLDGDHRYQRFNPAIGLTFTPTTGLNAYIGLNQGSRAPSSVELGCADPANPCKLPNAFAGDPPLRQVVTTTLEAGLRGGTPGALTWSLGLFRSDNKDDLLFVADDAAGFGYFKNFGKTRRQGVELGLAVTPAKGMTLGANYTWLDATYRSPEVVDGSSNSSNASVANGFPGVEGTIDIRPGDRIPLVPRHMLKLYADLQVSGALSVGLDVNAVGGSLARGNENGQHQADGVFYLGSGRNPGYAVLNLNAEYKPMTGLKLFAQVNNLFNRRYTTAAQLGATAFDANGNFQARPFAADANGDRPLRHSTFFAPGAPRSLTVGLKYNFN
ncbi:outer membrane receptor protein [Burkholderiales bacterium JOSHI_001]|nr:outer membrane receptor protein [Burkholderiales bacterium JOSHI_001]